MSLNNTDYEDRVRRAASPHGGALNRVREHVAQKSALESKRLGGRPALHVPKLNLADYLEAEAQPPVAVVRDNLGFNFGMLMNDKLGDCGEAMAIHASECFHLDAGTPVPQYQDLDAEVLYEEVGGYNPLAPLNPDGSNPTDQGTDNNVLVEKWQNPGVLCHGDGQRRTIAASVFVPPGNELVNQIAMWEFVVLFRAVGLPVTAQGQNGNWTLTDPSLAGNAAVGSWGYHDIPYIGYDQSSNHLITWGQHWLDDLPFDKAYAVGGFVVVTQEQLTLQGVSPSGVNWTKLNADLSALPSAPSA